MKKKQTFKCKYCGREHKRFPRCFEENPFCKECLSERIEIFRQKFGPFITFIEGEYSLSLSARAELRKRKDQLDPDKYESLMNSLLKTFRWDGTKELEEFFVGILGERIKNNEWL